MADCAHNYFTYFDELRENPWIGLSLPHEKPTMGSEAKWFADLYAKTLGGDAVAAVAVSGTRVVGLCTVERRVSPAEGHVGVLGVAILKEFRGIGVGRRLLTHSLEKCRGKFELVILEVFSNNTRARKLYESLGFRLAGCVPNGLKRGSEYTDKLLMYIELKGLDRG